MSEHRPAGLRDDRPRGRLAQHPQLPQQPGLPAAGDRLPAVLLRLLRRRPLGDRRTSPASTSPAATPPSSSSSCCCSRPPSAASSPASGSPATSRPVRQPLPARRQPTAAGSSPATPSRRWSGRFITWTVLTAIALVAGMNVDGSGVDLFGLYALAVLVNLTATMWAAGRGDAGALDPGRPADAVPGLPDPLPRPGLRAAEPAQRLDPRGRLGQPGDRAARGRPRLHLRRPRPWSPSPSRSAIGLPVLFALWARGGLRRAEAAG